MFPQIFGKYVLERELASGGMARVFLATLRGAGGFEKRLCVKQIRPELASDQCFIQRFVAEAKTTVDLSHANIVPVYELGAEQGTYYIAMELCAGVSLAELLGGGRMSPSEGAYIGVEICRALDYAHRKAGVVHRDVTPRNVMIDPEGMVRLIDFGIAAPASAAGSGLAFGSPGHMPPEQLRGGPLTPAADVFAVAVLLIEAWTGQPPFRRQNFEESVRALEESPPPLGQTEPALAALEPLIESALVHAASERPQTAEELARPLREFLRRDDLGDIARRLGQRVSERLRAQLRAPSSSETAGSAVRTPTAADSIASGGASTGTETFAARDVLRQWTAKIESGISTTGAPRPRAEPGRRPSSPSEIESSMTASPNRASEPPRAPSEIESGMTASTPNRASEPPRRHRRRIVLSAFALASSTLLGFALLGNPLGAPAIQPPAALQPTSPSPVLPPSPPDRSVATHPAPAVGSEPAAPDPARAAAAPSPAPDAVGSTRAARKPRSITTVTAAPVARLQLTAEPAAWVELDATRIGHTPLSSQLASPGRHTLGFVSQMLGEKLETTVTLEPATLTRIHADFTSANPRVIVR